jgi:hypothetical protein
MGLTQWKVIELLVRWLNFIPLAAAGRVAAAVPRNGAQVAGRA